MTKPDLRDFTRQELARALVSLGEKGSRIDRVFGLLHKKGASGFNELTGVDEALKQKLAERYAFAPAPKLEKSVSTDGTIKLSFTFADGARAESVITFSKEAASACVSSQAGCACGCVFCAAGAAGLKRDLKPSEILAQFAACRREAGRPLDSLKFAGSGEPFMNWADVKRSILIISDNKGYNFPQFRITVCTVGVVPVIRELADSHLAIRLAVSLITADEGQRAELTPVAKKYSLRQIIGAARYYGDRTKRSVLFDYIVFDGVNDTPQDAAKLLALLKELNCKVALTLYSPVPTGKPFTPGSFEKAKAFQAAMAEGGVRAHLRREKGADIAAGCGQLGTQA